jgi:hypothetical protein
MLAWVSGSWHLADVVRNNDTTSRQPILGDEMVKTLSLKNASVGGIAFALYHYYDWDPDAACCAAYAYRHGKPIPYTFPRAWNHAMQAQIWHMTPEEEKLVHDAYRRVKVGV